MGCTKGIKSYLKRKQQEENASLQFLRNGSALLEELIALSNGEYITSIRNFTAKELVWATNNYQEHIGRNPYGGMFKGNLERHQIVLKWKNLTNYSLKNLNAAACDIAISSLMSHLQNVLKLIGCCLEFEFPALVYEYAGSTLLTDFFRGCNSNRVLSWRSSIKIVSGIASLIVCTAFPTPIIHRNLNPFNVIIDQYGAAKLFDFSFAIALPPGESRVEDDVFGTFGLLDPEYYESSIVKERPDVYSFGVLLLINWKKKFL